MYVPYMPLVQVAIKDANPKFSQTQIGDLR